YRDLITRDDRVRDRRVKVIIHLEGAAKPEAVLEEGQGSPHVSHVERWARLFEHWSSFLFQDCARLVRPTIVPFSGGRKRERSDRRARPTATAGVAAAAARSAVA